MNQAPAKVTSRLLRRVRRVFFGLERCRLLKLRDAYQLVDDEVRVPYEGFPIQILLGGSGQRLHLYPEYPLLDQSAASGPPSFVLVDPDHRNGSISPFMRLEPKTSLTLGSADAEQKSLFCYPPEVAARHLRLIHDGDAVVFEDLTSVGTCISPALNELKSERLDCLRRLREIYGGPLQPLPPDEALDLILAVNALTQRECCRPLDHRGLPGGLVRLPEGVTPILLADLHARVDNLLTVLSHNGLLRALERGEAYLVIIGDAVHSERDGELDRMDDSMLIMDLIFRLKLRFPENFFFLRGNHESFSEEVAKGGIPQGLLWARALKDVRGKRYRKAMQTYYDQLPYVAASSQFAAMHAAPPRSKISTEMLVDIERYPGLIPELISNRMARPNRPGGYTKGDLRRFRKTLGLTADAPVIVGHTPLDREHTYWLDVGGAENHHILFSANENWVGAFVGFHGRLHPVRFPCEPLLDLVNTLPAPGQSGAAA